MKRFDCENIIRTEFGVKEQEFTKAPARPHWGARMYVKTHMKPIERIYNIR